MIRLCAVIFGVHNVQLIAVLGYDSRLRTRVSFCFGWLDAAGPFLRCVHVHFMKETEWTLVDKEQVETLSKQRMSMWPMRAGLIYPENSSTPRPLQPTGPTSCHLSEALIYSLCTQRSPWINTPLNPGLELKLLKTNKCSLWKISQFTRRFADTVIYIHRNCFLCMSAPLVRFSEKVCSFLV